MKRNRLTQPITSKPNYQEIIDKLELTTASASEVDFGEIFMDENMQEAVGTSTAKADLQSLTQTVNTVNNDLESVITGDGSGGGLTVDSVKGLIEETGTSFTIPNGTTKIRDFMFYNNKALTNLDIPDSVTSIGENAFNGCWRLALTSLPNGLTIISPQTFYNCQNLALTSLPSGITEIYAYSFYGCSKLAITEIPSGVTSIGGTAFYGCRELTTLTFLGTPTYIANNAFNNCSNLTTINVPWSEGAVSGAPWGAVNAQINYTYTA